MDDNEFFVGDIVQVVEHPYKKCPFRWMSEMSELLGQSVEIIDKWWSESHHTYGYRIKEDLYRFSWCGNCFKPIESTESDFEIESADALLELLTPQ